MDKAHKIKISTGLVEAEAELNNSNTALVIWKALPFNSNARRWGDEVYFSIPISLGEEDGKEVVEIGDLGYWPVGKAFCIFFGRTPASRGNEIRPASPVNVFGRLTSPPEVLRKIKKGSGIKVERLVGGI